MASVAYPRVRTRFVASAKFWLGRSDFHERLREATKQWNTHFPEFRYSPEPMHDVKPWQPGDALRMPPSFHRALKAMDQRTERDKRIVPNDQRLSEPYTAWLISIQHLCEQHWPSAWFPPWTGTLYSPAIGLVAGCLVHSPAIIEPDEWLPKQGFTPRLNTVDLVEESLKPIPQYWKARYRWLVEGLSELIRDETRLTLDHVNALEGYSEERAKPIMPHAGWPALNEPIAMLPLFRGMSTGDYRSAEPHVKELLDLYSLNDTLHAAAQQLDNAGCSRREVAGRLGIAVATVRDWLE